MLIRIEFQWKGEGYIESSRDIDAHWDELGFSFKNILPRSMRDLKSILIMTVTSGSWKIREAWNKFPIQRAYQISSKAQFWTLKELRVLRIKFPTAAPWNSIQHHDLKNPSPTLKTFYFKNFPSKVSFQTYWSRISNINNPFKRKKHNRVWESSKMRLLSMEIYRWQYKNSWAYKSLSGEDWKGFRHFHA